MAVLLSLPMLAVKVTIDGISYDLDAETKQVTVIEKSWGEYSGEVVIPESVPYNGSTYSVTSIGERAFRYCKGLTSVTIPNSVESIGEEAFFDCINLTSVVLPNNLTRIERRTFYNCSSLNTITIPNTVRSIGVGAIYGCKSLNSIIISPSVTLIEEYAFQECTGLSSVHISDLTAWCNITFEKMLSNPLYLAGHLFLNGKEIKDLIIPSGVTKIGYAGFCGGAGFTSVSIPNSVTSIGEWAFSYCSGLTSVTIGNGVTSIGGDAFSCCPELLDVYSYAENVPSTSSYAFYSSNYSNATLHVPDGSIESYKTTEPWSGFGKIVALTEEETSIDELKGENVNCITEIYDLSGRRVQKGQKGIFIQSGKVVVK